MFPTPKQRYERYVAYCQLMGEKPLSQAGYIWQLMKIPDYKPIAWTQSSNA